MERIKNFFLAVSLSGLILFWIFLILLFLAKTSNAFELVELNELSLDYKNYAVINSSSRNMLIYPEHPKEGINVNLNIDFFKYIFWNSTIESLTTSSQYRSVGLETRLGVRALPQLDVMYYHHSQHLLDGQHSYMNKYPVEDAIELKFYIYRGNK